MTQLLWAIALLAAVERDARIEPLSGEAQDVRIASLVNDQVRVGESGEEKSITALRVTRPQVAPPANPLAAWLFLTDGSRLGVASVETAKSSAKLTLSDGTKAEIPLSLVRAIRFGKLDDTTAPAEKADAAGDLIGVRKQETTDYLEGVVGDITPTAVNFSLEGSSVPVNRAKVESVVYSRRAAKDEPAANCLLEDALGSAIRAKQVSLKEDRLAVVTDGGAELTLPWNSIKTLDFSAGRFLYLADAKPESVDWQPYFGLSQPNPTMLRYFEPRRNRGRETADLRVGGKSYSRGLALTSRTEISYKVPAQAKRFMAIAGIDDVVKETGSVQLQISGDGKLLFGRKISGREGPQELDLDVSNVRRLTILVDYGEGLDIGDYLNLCEARIVK